MKSILDPTFKYSASFNTDLRKTFLRIRRDQQKAADAASPPCRTGTGNVASFVRRSSAAIAGNRRTVQVAVRSNGSDRSD